MVNENRADIWLDTTACFMGLLQLCCVFIQDVGEELDPSLEPVLAKAFVKRGNATLIKLGDKEIDFNPDFRLYITTKLGAHCALPAPMLHALADLLNLGLAYASQRSSLQVSCFTHTVQLLLE